MKKRVLIFLSLIIALALLIWFSCNPFQNLESVPSDLNILDSTDVMRSTSVTTFNDLSGAISNAQAGDVITITGTIVCPSRLNLTNSGTSSARITLQGGKLDFSTCSVSAIVITGSYWKLSNIEVYGGADRGIHIKGGSYNILENCYAHNFGHMGIEINEGGAYNEITGCISNDNYDVPTGGENADGFGCKYTGGAGNVFRNCTGNHNSDDGWDLYKFTAAITFYSCKAENNGYGTDGDGVGFKLGGPDVAANHILYDCVANYNKHYGFSSNYNTGTITYINCTGTGNGSGLFDK